MTVAAVLLVVALVLARLALHGAGAREQAGGPEQGGGSAYAEGSPGRRMPIPVVAVLAALAVLFAAGAVGALVTRPRTVKVMSASMSPALLPGDRILAMRGTPGRGSIVVIGRDPGGLQVKRVVGLPGDTIEGRGDGRVYVGGQPLDEPYLPESSASTDSPFGPVTLGAGDYFVLGDNRSQSADSRLTGPVARDQIRYVVRAIVWPSGRARLVG